MVRSPWEVTLDRIYYRAFFEHNPLRAWVIPESQTTSFWDMCLLSALWLSKVLWEQSRAREGTSDIPVFMLPQINSLISASGLTSAMKWRKQHAPLELCRLPYMGGFEALVPCWICSAWKTETLCNASFYVPLKKEGRL